MNDVICSRFVMAGGIRTHFVEAGGNGTPMVLVHGGGGSGEWSFGEIIPLLAQNHRVIAPDCLGGRGETDTRAPVVHGIGSQANHFETFADAICLDQFILVGHSQGAWAAARYAIRHPDRVNRLVLLASATIAAAMGIESPPTPARQEANAYDGTRDSMRRLLETSVFDKSKVTDELIDARQALATRPGVREQSRAFAEGTRLFTSEPNLRLNFDLRETLPLLSIPTIFIWGQDDLFALPEWGRALETLLPRVKFYWVASANHNVQKDQPAEVARIILDFVGG